MSFEIGVGYFNLVPSGKGMSANIAKELGDATGAAAKQAGTTASKSFGDVFAKGLKGAGGSLANATKEITASLGNVAVLGGAAIGLAAAASVKGFAGFEQSLNVLQATAHATSAEMVAVSAKAKILGADMSLPATSAADAANAMTDLARGGLSVADAMGAAKGTLELVAAATVSEGEAAIDVATEIKAFALAGTDATHVADLLTGAITNSGTDLATFANGLAQVSAVAHDSHISIEDTVTAVAELVKNGQDASVAGTTLAQFLLRLTGPTKKAREEIDKLGITVFDSKGAMLPLRTIIDSLAKSTIGLSDQQRKASFTTIFGARAIRAADILASQGASAFDALGIAIQKPGSAADIAAAKMKGLSGTLEGIKSVVETIGLDVGQIMEPALQAAESAVSGEVQSLNTFADALSTALSPARVTEFGHIVGSVLSDVRTEIKGVEGPIVGAGAALALTFGSKLPIVGNFIEPLGLMEGAFLGIVATSGVARGALVNFGEDLVSVGVSAAPELIGGLKTIQDAAGPAFARIVDGADKLAVTALPALAHAAADLAPPFAEFITQGSRLVDEVLPRIGEDIAGVAPAVSFVFGGALHLAAEGLKLLADNASVSVPIIVGLGTAFAAFRLAKVVSDLDLTKAAVAAFGRASETFKVEFLVASAEEGAAATAMGAAVAGGTAVARAGLAAFGTTLTGALPFAAVALGVGLLTKVFTDNAARARENKQAIDSLTTAMESQDNAVAATATVLGNMIQQQTGMQKSMDLLNVSVQDITDAFAKGPAAVEELRNSLAQQGKQAGLTDDQIVDLTGGIVRLQQKYDPAKDAADRWLRVNKQSGDTAGVTAGKIDEQRQALDDLVQATFASFNSQISYSRATDSTTKALQDLQQAQFFASQAGKDNLAVNQQLSSVALEVQSSIVGQADAAVRVATDNAKATGATLTYAQSLGVYRDELLKIKTAHPELSAAVDALVAQLDSSASKAGVAGGALAGQYVSGVSTGLITGGPALNTGVTTLLGGISAGQLLADAIASGRPIGRSVSDGIAQGVSGAELASRLISEMNDALAKVRAVFGIHSPSTVFAEELGKPLGQGVALGFVQQSSVISAAMQKVISDGAFFASVEHNLATSSLATFTQQVQALEAQAAAATQHANKKTAQAAKDLTTNAEQARGSIIGIVQAALDAQKEMSATATDTAVSVGIGATRIIAAMSPTGDVFKAAAADAKQFASSVTSAFHSAFNIVSDFESAVSAQSSKVSDAQQQATENLQAAQQQVDSLRSDYTDAFSTIVQSLGAATAAQVANRNESLDALKDIAAGASSFASSMTSSFTSATDVVSAFGSETFVTGNQVLSFFTGNVKAATKWATDLKTLSSAGLNQGILQQLAQAGPKAEPLVKALLADVAAGNLDAINKAQTDLDSILGDTIDSIGASLVPAFAQGSNVGKSISDGVAAGIVGSSGAIQAQLQSIITQVQASNAAMIADAQASTVDIVALFQQQVDAAKTWSDELSTLAKSGIDQGLLRQLAEAGPQAEPIIKDLLAQVAAGNLGVINQAQTDLGSLLQDTINSVADQIAPALVQGQNLGAGIDSGIVQGIVAGSPAIQAAIAGAVQSAIDAAKQAAGIHSPSTLFADEVGLPIVQGTALGIRKSAHLVANESAAMVRSALPSMAAIRSGASAASAVLPAAGGGQIVNNIMLDGKVIQTQVFEPWADDRDRAKAGARRTASRSR